MLFMNIMLFIMFSTMFFMLLDELMMGCAQSRIGPNNLGGYGFYSSLINGCNLMISQFLVPKLYFYFGFQLFPMFFFVFSLQNYILLYPLFLINIYFSMMMLIWLMGMSMVMIIFFAFSSCSKYSMLGCIRMMSQLMSFELMWTTIMATYILYWNEFSITSYWSFIFSLIYFCMVCYWMIINNYIFLIFFFICILGESNSVPYDLPEAESELVAGLITEFSSILFSLIIFTEYANIISVLMVLIILFSLNYDCLMFFIYFVCLIRTTLNSFKFDELMTSTWIIFVPIMFSLCFMHLFSMYYIFTRSS